MKKTLSTLVAFAGLTTATGLYAATVVKTGDIVASETWTANNTYQLDGAVRVKAGATLTIEAGTNIVNVVADEGTLIVERGGKLIARGTATKPIIFTSENDPQFGGSDSLGTQEWGNITMLGEGVISYSRTNANVALQPVATYNDGFGAVANTAVPTALNKSLMEGLLAGDPGNNYGGGNDDDDSGTLAYVSLRYGGRLIGDPNRELNGLSLGGIGRETDIHHVDIWNNIDDGIEIWGGTVSFKYVSIWNIGDDSFDVDQGWRGKAQFGLIVQGYSQTSGVSSGSGIGDNAFEIDGAEAYDAQPVTTTTIYNFTVIGQPDGQISGRQGSDHAFAWRDASRVQFRNCIFMDIGERIVRLEASESGTPEYLTGWTNGQSYSETGTTGTPGHILTPIQQWATAYTVLPTGSASAVSPFTPAELYTAQSAGDASIGQGFLNEMTDTVFYNNTNGSAYSEPVTGGPYLTSSGASLPAKGNVVATSLPISALARGTAFDFGSIAMALVTGLDPALLAMQSPAYRKLLMMASSPPPSSAAASARM
ncbi:MAG: hypothetical protein HC898_00355 [Phycisphaerales bacterium]|nr:hypothetical protein [Phycisphaerales bacterium]